MRPSFYLACFFLLAAFGDAHYSAMKEGNEKYRAGDFAGAAALYAAARKANDSPAARYNEGAALYQLRQHGEAAKRFGSVAEEKEAALKAKAALNLANAQNADGAERLKRGDAAAARQALESAVAGYRQALLEHPENMAAKRNMEIALKRLDAIPPQDGRDGKSGDRQEEEKKESGKGGGGEGKGKNADAPKDKGAGERDKKNGGAEKEEGDGAGESGSSADPNAMKKEQADRILRSLAQGEEKTRRDMRRYNMQEREVEKDW